MITRQERAYIRSSLDPWGDGASIWSPALIVAVVNNVLQREPTDEELADLGMTHLAHHWRKPQADTSTAE